MPRYEPEPLPVRKREVSSYKLYREEKESAPMFTFHLRPRVMQEGATCKLLCCCTGTYLAPLFFSHARSRGETRKHLRGRFVFIKGGEGRLLKQAFRCGGGWELQGR